MRKSLRPTLDAGVVFCSVWMIVMSGCDDGTKPPDPPDPLLPDLDCVGSLSSLFVDYVEINGICMAGTSPVGAPNVEVEVPWYDPYTGLINSYNAFDTWSTYDAATDDYELWVAKNPSGPLVSTDYNPITNFGDGTSWPWVFDELTCDYTLDAYNWLVNDGLTVAFSDVYGPDCDSGYLPLPPLPAATGRVASGSQVCVAGEADFDLVVRRVFGNDGTKATMVLAPVTTTTGVAVPERAWLRELKVLSWGSATNLHLATADNRPIEVNDWTLNGTTITKPASGIRTVTYAAGVNPMSVGIGTQEMPIGTTNTLPKLRLKWSCEASTASAIAGFTPHVLAAPAELSPLKHRIVFWVSTDGKKVHVAPEGRYLDYVPALLKTYTGAGGGKTFFINLPNYDATITGRLVTFGSSYKLYDATISYPSGSTVLGTKTLSPL